MTGSPLVAQTSTTLGRRQPGVRRVDDLPAGWPRVLGEGLAAAARNEQHPPSDAGGAVEPGRNRASGADGT